MFALSQNEVTRYRDLAARGDPEAMVVLAEHLEFVDQTISGKLEATRLFIAAAKRGNMKAASNVAIECEQRLFTTEECDVVRELISVAESGARGSDQRSQVAAEDERRLRKVLSIACSTENRKRHAEAVLTVTP